MAHDTKRPKESWLTLPPFSADFAKAAIDRFEAEQKRLKSSKRHDRIRRAWQQVYSRDDEGACDNTLIQRKGHQGEVLELRPNRFARILRDNLNDVRISPPNVEPQALNSSAKAQDQVKIARGVLDWYDRRLHLPAMRIRRVEVMQLAGEAVEHIWFDAQRGREIGVGNSAEDLASSSAGEMTGEPETSSTVTPEDEQERAASRPIRYEGDYVVSVRSPYDYALDPTSPDERKPRWSIIREPVDRYEAIKLVRREQQAAKANGAKSDVDYEDLVRGIMEAEPWSERMTDWKYETEKLEFDDSIAVYHVYGERSMVVEDGRHAIVLDSKRVLIDGPLVEDRAGVFVQRARDVIFKVEPHSDVYDGLPIAEAHGACVTTMLSNTDAFGLQRMLSPRKANASSQELGAGLSVVEYDHADPSTGVDVPPPMMMQMTPMSSDVFNLEALLTRELDMVLGGSAVRRGDPDATKGDSGSKTAMLYAASQTANSPLITSTLEVDAERATWVIGSLQKRATTPRITTIVGEKNAAIAREFTGADLDEISLVTVKPANPARDTFEGRMAMVEVLKDVEDPQKRDMIMALITTGQIDSEIEPDEAERMLIERENSLLLNPATPDEELPVVNSYDQHQQHIMGHKCELADPQIRRDPVRTQRIMMHNQWHIDALTPGNQRFAGHEVLLLTGQQALPPPPPPPGAMPPEGMDAGATPGPNGPAQAPQGAPPGPGVVPSKQGQPPGRSGMPSMPDQPKNPATGERMNLPVPSAPNMGA